MAELSVIVTSYNIERYLAACLDSIVNQTLEDLEIIIVDDGSSDSSPQIITEYAERDSRIIPILLGDNSIGGVATAANAGLEVASAPYVGFADGDDICELDMFESMLSAAKANNADLVMCDYETFTDETGEHNPPADHHRWAELSRDYYELDEATRINFLRFIAVPWRKLYRHDLLADNNIRFPVGDYFYEDNPFHWFALLHARSIALVPRVLCYHRVARPGQTMSTGDERLLRMFEHHETIHNFLTEQGAVDGFNTTLLSWAMSQMEWIAPRMPADLHRALFDSLVPVFRHYSDADIERALTEGRKGTKTRDMSFALQGGDYLKFVRALTRDSRGGGKGLVRRLVNHLKYSGPKQTAKIGAKYLNQRFSFVNKVSQLASGRERQSGNQDEELLFVLATLEARLERIERLLEQDRS